MLGVAYLFENKPDDARREFHKLLELRPDYRFDPLLDPQRVVDFFNGVLKDEEAVIAEMEQRRLARIRKFEPPGRRLPPVVMRYERHSFAVNFVPFGAGQFQNGQRRKGWLFLGIESFLGAVSVGAVAANLSIYGLTPHRMCNQPQPMGIECPQSAIDHSQEDRSRLLVGVQVASGALFWAVSVWGVIDAIYYHQSEVLMPEGTKVSRAPSGPRLTFSPNGLGAVWAF